MLQQMLHNYIAVYSMKLCAKKVVFDTCTSGLVDFAVQLVDRVWKVKFLEEMFQEIKDAFLWGNLYQDQ